MKCSSWDNSATWRRGGMGMQKRRRVHRKGTEFDVIMETWRKVICWGLEIFWLHYDFMKYMWISTLWWLNGNFWDRQVAFVTQARIHRIESAYRRLRVGSYFFQTFRAFTICLIRKVVRKAKGSTSFQDTPRSVLLAYTFATIEQIFIIVYGGAERPPRCLERLMSSRAYDIMS